MLDPVTLRLSAQRALLGEVGPGLLAVCIGARQDTVVLTFFIRPDTSESEREDLLGSVAGQVAGDFEDGIGLDEQIEEVDPTSREFSRPFGDWVFLRREFAERASVLQANGDT